MKMDKILNILGKNRSLLLVLGVVVSSCNLEIEESDSLQLDENVGTFAGVENVGGQLDNIYSNITGQSGDQANLYAMTEVTTDELLVPTRGTDWGDNGVWRTLHSHTWGPTHAHVLAVWNDKNSAVLRASEILSPLTEGATAAELASAHFARAYNMWFVMDFYGQVPYRYPVDPAGSEVQVLPRAQALDTVEADLRAAILNLPDSDPAAANKTRPVKATAQFWLAKLLLNAHIYRGDDPINSELQEVISLVDEIEAAGYALEADYFNIFPGPQQSNSEVIWTVDASSGNRMWNGLHYNQQHPDNTGGGWNGFTTLAEFYDLFEGEAETNEPGDSPDIRRGYTQTMATTNDTNYGFGFGFQVGQMYGWVDGEAAALNNRTGAPLSFTRDLPALVGNTEVTGIRVLKYSPVNGGFTNGVVMARYADAHLMRAEAMFWLNQAGALAEINELRTFRGATALGTLTAQDIIDERGRELYTEGWRRNDLIRFGEFTESWSFKEVSGDETKNLFPIPASALLSNPNLTQNPGY